MAEKPAGEDLCVDSDSESSREMRIAARRHRVMMRIAEKKRAEQGEDLTV